MTRLPQALARLPLLLLGLIVSLAVLANATSRWLEQDFPEAALTTNPLNSQAVLNIGIKEFSGEPAAGRSKNFDLYRHAKDYAPADARLHSMLGIAKEAAGNAASAREDYSQALHLLPTEYQALARVFVQNVDERQYDEAARKIELFVRRWPQLFGILRTYVIEMSLEKDGLTALEKLAINFPKARQSLVGMIAGKNGNLPAAYDLVQKWHAGGVAPLQSEILTVEKALIRQKRPNAAYEFFSSTRSESVSNAAGYIFNSDFALPFSGSVYDWRIRKQTGVTINRVEIQPDDQVPRERQHYLNVRFLGNPLQFRNIYQTIRLPSGTYRLEFLFAMNNLKTPKPLKFNLTCTDTREKLVTLEIPNGTSVASRLEALLTVPTGECLFSTIEFNHAFVPLSFRNRFEGELNIHDIRLIRVSG